MVLVLCVCRERCVYECVLSKYLSILLVLLPFFYREYTNTQIHRRSEKNALV
jgi:hypothetical protein